MKLLKIMALCALAFTLSPAFAQTKPATDNMQILRDKLKADKKLVVAANMELTEAEGKKFWPVYDEYQAELKKINERMRALILAYAKEYKADSLTDDNAKKMSSESIGIEESETKLKRSIAAKLDKALPGRKVARYLQIESKIRAVVKYELADSVPLVP